MRYAKDEGLTTVLPLLSKAATSHLSQDLRKLESPLKNGSRIRLLPNQQDRDRLRARKQTRPLNLTLFAKNSEKIWASVSSNFSMYARGSLAYRKEIERANTKAMRFKDLGCLENYNLIERDVRNFEAKFRDNYYGFYRLTITETAVVLAKLHGGQVGTGGTIHIGYPPQQADADPLYAELRNLGAFAYKPWVVPFWAMNPKPQNMLGLVDYLESLPEAGNRPVFDHYLVIMPGINSNRAELTVTPTDVRPSESFYQHAIARKYFIPALLGERDGKTYFISYWM
jgi:hypothetical protein